MKSCISFSENADETAVPMVLPFLYKQHEFHALPYLIIESVDRTMFFNLE